PDTPLLSPRGALRVPGERLLDRAQHTQVRARAPDDVTPGRTTRPGRGVVRAASLRSAVARRDAVVRGVVVRGGVADPDARGERLDRKSTRLNSSHVKI